MLLKHGYLFLFVLLVFHVGLSNAGPGVIEKMADVKIINGFDNRTQIGVHCKSKDDDLGPHVLGFDQSFEFRFRPSFLGTTLFFCRFWWESESHWFDIYVQSRDAGRCNKKCWWLVGPAGPCLYNSQIAVYDICANWNKNPGVPMTGNNTAKTYQDLEVIGVGKGK